MTLFMALVVVLGFAVVSFGLQKGLERISKFMMTALLLLILMLAVNSCLLPGAGEGLSFYLLPSLSRAKEQGLFSVITAAMNQAFFTLSLGIAAMEIFGSYMTRENTLTGEERQIDIDEKQLLSEREITVIKLVSQGMSSKMIASKLDISKNTVDRHRQNIINKMQVSNMTEACNKAKQLLLV